MSLFSWIFKDKTNEDYIRMLKPFHVLVPVIKTNPREICGREPYLACGIPPIKVGSVRFNVMVDPIAKKIYESKLQES